MTEQDIAELAERFVNALGACDLETLRRIYAEDAIIWHNSDGIEMTVSEHMISFRQSHDYLRDLRYVDIRRHIFRGGFVQQHRVEATTPGGTSFDLPCCIVCKIDGGRVTRLDEYWDSAALDRAGLRPKRPDRARAG